MAAYIGRLAKYLILDVKIWSQIYYITLGAEVYIYLAQN